MWERADGVPTTRCAAPNARLTKLGLRLGETTTQALFGAGQPSSRPGRSYRYCVTGSPSRHVSAVFDRGGRLVLIATRNARGKTTYLATRSERRDATRLRADLRAAGF
jgi:hypothetical protein